MAKKILVAVEKRLFRKTLQEALLVAQPGDTLVLDPGTYTHLQGFQIFHPITIEGAGSSPEDVVFQGKFHWNQAIHVTMKNLTVESAPGNNAVTVINQGQLEAVDCIFKGEFAGVYPAIYINSSKIFLRECNVFYNNKRRGLCLENGADGTITGCSIDSVAVDRSTLVISNSQIRTILGVSAAIVKGKEYLEVLQNNDGLYGLFLEDGSKGEFETIGGS